MTVLRVYTNKRHERPTSYMSGDWSTAERPSRSLKEAREAGQMSKKSPGVY